MFKYKKNFKDWVVFFTTYQNSNNHYLLGQNLSRYIKIYYALKLQNIFKQIFGVVKQTALHSIFIQLFYYI